MNKQIIGFYKLAYNENKDSIIGALLVTDDLGKPEEFRVTHPVKPTTLQKQLYGDSLLSTIALQLCGKPLVESLQKEPDLIVVSQPELIPLGEQVRPNLVHLERAGETLEVQDLSSNTTSKRQLSSESGRFEPINVNYPKTYDQQRKSEIEAFVQDAFNGIDLLEPFTRVDVAVNTLKQMDDGFK